MITNLTSRERSHDGFMDRIAAQIGRRASIEPFSPVVWSCSCGSCPPPPGAFAETFIFRGWHWGDGRPLTVFALRDPAKEKPAIVGFAS